MFKQIDGFGGVFLINEHGDIYNQKTGNYRVPHKDEDGYLRICLTYKDEMKTFGIHRLVATYFIPNPDGLPEVDHIDNNRTNNDASNLRWCTRYDNMNNQNNKIKRICKHPAIEQIKDGVVVGEYETFCEAARAVDRNNTAVNHISRCCHGRETKYLGYTWRFKENGNV